ncbi:MAG: hypothetical protein EAX91_07760 [Candidatus Lokiarchaeota archaeon]|nr:hypothetical protein [Candidatus Lokiarchaeota archaeon]
MEAAFYWFGVLLAILGGCAHYSGLILEKSVINKMPIEVKLMKNLIKKPQWLLAIFIRFGVGSILFIFAQVLIGPAITPGLMASGLIILAVGSIKILNERLKLVEFVAIIVMIIAVVSIGLSNLSIAIAEENLLDPAFLIRMITTSSIFGIICTLFQVIQNKYSNIASILLALISGLMLSLNNFWITPFIWSLMNLLSGNFNLGIILLFLVSIGILIIANIFGVIKMAQGFRLGRASYLAPIQNVPVQLAPSILYFIVFLMEPPNLVSIILFILGVTLIILSSFFLGRRQAEIEIIS